MTDRDPQTVSRMNLRVPGPTPVPTEVARAGARPMVNHRGPEFAGAMAEVIDRLKPFFGTTSEPLLLTGSGTGGQEAAIVNVLSPGDEILAVSGGVFGDRFAAIAQAFGAVVHRLETEWGSAASPAAVAAAVSEHPRVKGVLLTHNETSTGVTNDVAALSAAVRREAEGDPVILVDGVSSIGALPFNMDSWDVDVAITGSQKAWMSPPGIAMIAVSERGWRAHANAHMPRFYWDFSKARKNAEKRTTPFTPAVGVVHALQEALRLMHEEGRDNVFARHRRIGRRMRDGIAALGLELFANPQVASDTVTAVRVPASIDAAALIRGMRKRGVVVGSGQDWLKGSIFRVGHMGWVHEEDIDLVLDALRAALTEGSLEAAG
jgi:aspartate aminotransferase-like enzyme